MASFDKKRCTCILVHVLITSIFDKLCIFCQLQLMQHKMRSRSQYSSHITNVYYNVKIYDLFLYNFILNKCFLSNWKAKRALGVCKLLGNYCLSLILQDTNHVKCSLKIILNAFNVNQYLDVKSLQLCIYVSSFKYLFHFVLSILSTII